jgi:integrase/recombinase XerC
MINLPAIKIVRTTPPSSLGEGSAVENRLTVKPVAPGVWDEFLALQISPATRRSYAAGLRDFFRREFQVSVSGVFCINPPKGGISRFIYQN